MSVHTSICGFASRDTDRVVLLFRRSKRETWMLLLTGKRKTAVAAGSSFTGFFEPDRCDLSPDGMHFLYYAIGRDRRHFDTKFKYWTAICRPPLVRALAFFPHRVRDGGGGWIDETGTFQIDAGSGPAFDPAEAGRGSELPVVFNDASGARSCDWGWSDNDEHSSKAWGKAVLLRRDTPSARDDGFVGGAYSVALEEELPLADVTWADIDSSGKLLTARGSELTIYPTTQNLVNDSGTRLELADVIAQKSG